jgi:alkyl hydroperoxide reductase subunit D
MVSTTSQIMERNMNITQLKEALPSYAKDIKLNLSNVLSEEGSPDLTQKQIWMIASSAAVATRNPQVMASILVESLQYLTPEEVEAAKAAAVIMAMNNIYYRFTHMMSDKSYAGMPAKLRMNVIANSGADKIDFELSSLAVPAMNGCGMCMESHAHHITEAGISNQAVQSAVRIAAVLQAAAVALESMISSN